MSKIKKSQAPRPSEETKISQAVRAVPGDKDIPTDEVEIYIPPKFDKASADAHPATELANRVLAGRHLLHFIKRYRPKYLAGWVHEDICRRLERFVKAVERGESPRLLLMMPPRSGKSEIGSRHFPAWALGHHPEWEIIAASHTSSLSLSFSRYIRDLLRDPSYHDVFSNTHLDPNSQSVEKWNTTEAGGYLSAGVGTGITGRGAHILLLDDLVKDIEAADSVTIRDNTWEWYISTAYTRLAPGGGVLGIMCMTGDTPVLMADGSQRRLDALTPSDRIATYARGILAASTVAAVRLSGRDSVFKITMSSGKIVRANQRHPFLTVAPSGELSWTRLKNLTTALRIVSVKDSGVNGKGLLVLPRGVISLPNVADFAQLTITVKNGLMVVEPSATAMSPAETHDSSIATGLPQPSMTHSTSDKKDAAQSAESAQKLETHPDTGKTSSLLTTVMTPEKSEDCFATTATQESDILVMNQWHLPPRGISDFTLDEIVSIELDGVEEVFDVQVDATENFIANGLVSHNTWWNDDDWAGKIQQVMASGEGDKFEIVKYPAINEKGDEYLLPDDHIVEILPGHPVPDGAKLTRPHKTALHPARYNTEAMLRIKRNLVAAGQMRIWSALYQQNPAPDEGVTFRKDMFRFFSVAPPRRGRTIIQAWDFAITEGEQNDWTVGVTLMEDEFSNIYVLDVNRFKSGDGEFIVDEILDYARTWDVDLIGFEDGQIWKSIFSTFERRCTERKQFPPYEILVPLTDKLVRAGPLKGRMQLGKVLFNKNLPYYTDLEHEMLRFPAGKHDDQVDALSWGVRTLLTRQAPKQEDVEPKKTESWMNRLFAKNSGGASHMSA